LSLFHTPADKKHFGHYPARHHYPGFTPSAKTSNPLSGQEVRMVKVNRKSPAVCEPQRGKHFARIRGYLSTTGKNDLNPLEKISDATTGKPFPPETSS